ncbi:MAG TPA: ABC transporter substrate-binding protein [Ktedonobacteraceae bacterium]|nr:ABC transporter substrate-binding protein [Ktedonobacteraceae bacterium]
MFPIFRSHRGQRPSVGLLFVGVIVALTLLLAACGSSTTGSTPVATQNPATPTVAPPTDLITPGTLTVGSDTTYPPQEYIDNTTNKATGFDVDLITAIGQRMGLKVNVVTAKFDTIIDDLANKRYDVVISAITINAARQQKADFVPYFNAGESLLVQNGNPKNIKGLSDLCGQNVGVQTGTVEQTDLQTASDACKKAGKPAINMTVLQDQTAVVQLLASNRVVATFQDSPVTDYYNKQHPGQFTVGGSVINAAQEGIAVRKGDTSMFNAIQTAFNQLKADGTYTSIINKWGLTTGAISVIDRRNTYAVA